MALSYFRDLPKVSLIAVPYAGAPWLAVRRIEARVEVQSRRIFGRVDLGTVAQGRSLDWPSWSVLGMDDGVCLTHGGPAKIWRFSHTAVKA